MGNLLDEQPGDREPVEFCHFDSWFGPQEILEGCQSDYTEYVVLRFVLSSHLDLRDVPAPKIVGGDDMGNEVRIRLAYAALLEKALTRFDIYEGEGESGFLEFYDAPVPVYRCVDQEADHWLSVPDTQQFRYGNAHEHMLYGRGPATRKWASEDSSDPAFSCDDPVCIAPFGTTTWYPLDPNEGECGHCGARIEKVEEVS